jgi:hypothetical protein
LDPDPSGPARAACLRKCLDPAMVYVAAAREIGVRAGRLLGNRSNLQPIAFKFTQLPDILARIFTLRGM